MKFWIAARALFRTSDCYRSVPGYALYSSCRPGLQFCGTHHSRRQLRVITTISSRQRGFLVLYLYLLPHWTGNLLRFFPLPAHLKYRCDSSLLDYGDCIFRLCSPLRSDVLLRGYSYYEFIICYPLSWEDASGVSLRRVCC